MVVEAGDERRGTHDAPLTSHSAESSAVDQQRMVSALPSATIVGDDDITGAAPPPGMQPPVATWTLCIVTRHGDVAHSSSAGPETVLPWERVVYVSASPVTTPVEPNPFQPMMEGDSDDMTHADVLAVCRRYGSVEAVTRVPGLSDWLVQFKSSFECTRFRTAVRRRDPRCRLGAQGSPIVSAPFALSMAAAVVERSSGGGATRVWLPIDDRSTLQHVLDTLQVAGALKC